MRALEIECAEAFEPLLQPSRYKAAYGGRGSGKSHFFAELLIAQCVLKPGTRAVCIREVQKSLKESAKRLIEDKLVQFGLGEADGFRITKEQIETPGGGVIIFQGMQDHTAESIKSLEGYRIAWVEEAQTLSARSLSLLRPTIRAENSEIWFSWNPTRETDPVDKMFRGDELPTNSIVVRANFSENPWFPAVLEQERQDCQRITPEQYGHIWLGEYATVLEGAYYAGSLLAARQEGRIGVVARDPIMAVRAFWDIGGTGNRADATSIIIAQFVGREIRVLDYYEAVGQPLEAHLTWLRTKGYGNAEVTLPHDGANAEKIFKITYESAIRQAGFSVTTVPNQGEGAYMLRIEAGRRLFPSIWFNEATTKPLLSALGWYHEKRDEKRNYGLGEQRDWSNHGADAFGLMCISYEAPRQAKKVRHMVGGAQGWMG